MPSRFCDCEHQQAMHVQSKKECREDGCRCRRFQPRQLIPPLLVEHVEPDAADVLAQVVPRAADLELRPKLEETTVVVEEEPPAPLTQLLKERDEALHDLAHATFQLDAERTRVAHWVDQLELARAELASARQEIDRLIAQQGDVRQAAEEKVRAALAGQPPHLATSLAEALADKELAEGRLAEANQNITALQESVKGSESTASMALRDLIEARTEADNLRVGRNRAESELAEARQVIEAMEDDVPAALAAAGGVVLQRTEHWTCQPITGCGESYAIKQDDDRCVCGARLIPITLTTTL